MGRETAAALNRWAALQDHPVPPRLAAVCDVDPDVLPWFERIETVRLLSTDYRDLLGDDRLEVLYIAVPHHLHEELYLAAIEAGKDFLGEKPFGIDLPAAERILAALRGRPDLFARCSSVYALLQDLVAERPGPDGSSVPCDTIENATLVGTVDAADGPFPLTIEVKRIAPGDMNTWRIRAVGMAGGVEFSTARPKTVRRFAVRDGDQVWEHVETGSQSAFPTVTGAIFEFGFSDAVLQMWAAFLAERAGALDEAFPCATPEEARVPSDPAQHSPRYSVSCTSGSSRLSWVTTVSGVVICSSKSSPRSEATAVCTPWNPISRGFWATSACTNPSSSWSTCPGLASNPTICTCSCAPASRSAVAAPSAENRFVAKMPASSGLAASTADVIWAARVGSSLLNSAPRYSMPDSPSMTSSNPC